MAPVDSDIIEDSPLPIDAPPDLNRIYVHPLLLIGTFVLHTSVTVLATLFVAPSIAAATGVSIAVMAAVWFVIGLAATLLALYRQHTMEGSIYAR